MVMDGDDYACKFLGPKTIEEFWELLEFSILLQNEQLYVKCMQFASSNMMQVISHPKFMNLKPKTLALMLKYEPLRGEAEFLLFEGTMKWVEVQCERRGLTKESKNMHSLLEEEELIVRLSSMGLVDKT